MGKRRQLMPMLGSFIIPISGLTTAVMGLALTTTVFFPRWETMTGLPQALSRIWITSLCREMSATTITFAGRFISLF
jgi:hypothetical protein